MPLTSISENELFANWFGWPRTDCAVRKYLFNSLGSLPSHAISFPIPSRNVPIACFTNSIAIQAYRKRVWGWWSHLAFIPRGVLHLYPIILCLHLPISIPLFYWKKTVMHYFTISPFLQFKTYVNAHFEHMFSLCLRNVTYCSCGHSSDITFKYRIICWYHS